MPTPSGHTDAIRASRVIGTTVYNTAGDHIGEIEDVILEKTANDIMFAVIGFGGFLGIGEKYHAVPWSVLDYDPERGGYVVPFTKEQLKAAPGLRHRRADAGRRLRRARHLVQILQRRAVLALIAKVRSRMKAARVKARAVSLSAR